MVNPFFFIMHPANVESAINGGQQVAEGEIITSSIIPELRDSTKFELCYFVTAEDDTALLIDHVFRYNYDTILQKVNTLSSIRSRYIEIISTNINSYPQVLEELTIAHK